jgi:hypothetical protein
MYVIWWEPITTPNVLLALQVETGAELAATSLQQNGDRENLNFNTHDNSQWSLSVCRICFLSGG